MPRFADRISGVLLSFLRTRRGSTLRTAAAQEPPKSASTSQPQIRQRKARFSDFEAVSALKTKYGLGPDSKENWQRLWQDNPALVSSRGEPCMGWILEAEEEV